MQAPTHILAGVVIGKLFEWRTYRGVAMFLTAVLALLSHAVLDKLARVTYHQPEADFGNPAWVGFHLVVVLVTVIFLYLWWTDYKWSIVFALLPDLEWLIIYPQHALNREIPFYSVPHLHHAMKWMMEHTIPFCYLDMLPDNSAVPLAAIWEVVPALFLIVFIRFMDNRRKNIHFH